MAQKLSREEFIKLNQEIDITTNYTEIQNRILSYDLSDIPFEDWKYSKMVFGNDYIIDFSKTHANIDFDIIKFFGTANFKGCNIRNLEKMRSIIKPEFFDNKTIKENSDIFLSDNIPEELKNKIYSNSALLITDVNNLSKEQLNEISYKIDKILPKSNINKNYKNNSIIHSILYEALGLEKLVEFYNSNREEYEVASQILSLDYFSYLYAINTIVDKLKTAEMKDIKNVCFDVYKEKLIKYKHIDIPNIETFEPKLFIEKNKDLFLVDKNIPSDVKERYFKRKLKIEDILNYYEEFKDIPLDNFIRDEDTIYRLDCACEIGEYQKLIKKYPLVFKYLSSKNEVIKVGFYMDLLNLTDLETSFLQGIKEYIIKRNLIPRKYFSTDNGTIIIEHLPKWIKSLGFNFMTELKDIESLMNYSEKTFILANDSQKRLIAMFGIDNIKRLEQKTNIFSLDKFSLFSGKSTFGIIQEFLSLYHGFTIDEIPDFKKGSLPYEKFEKQFVKLLSYMRKEGYLKRADGYKKITGEFREKYPEIFIDEKAPEELKKAFYAGEITPKLLFQKENYIPYLINKNPKELLNIKTKIFFKPLNLRHFVTTYVENNLNVEKLLKLIVKYGDILDEITIECEKEDFNNYELLEKAIKEAIKKNIITNNSTTNINYEYLKNVPDFYLSYPELFVDFKSIKGLDQNTAESLEKLYYSSKFTFETIRKYPQLIEQLKNKNLEIPFNGQGKDGGSYAYITRDALVLKDVYGNEKFLKLCSKYGRYLRNVVGQLSSSIYIKNKKIYHILQDGKIENIDSDIIDKFIEKAIAHKCLKGMFRYTDEDAPEFLKQQHPELFLNEDAPEELKDYYYHNKKIMSFKLLQEHPEWIPYLEDKLISQSLMLASTSSYYMGTYFELFGEKKGLLLGMKKPDTVNKMIDSGNVFTMKKWYDKTGGKFIPDVVIMANINIEDADKFLSNTTNWNKLMKLTRFSSKYETRDGLLKLAYSFGVFDGDKRGFNKLYGLLTDIPRKTNLIETACIDEIDDQLKMIIDKLNIKKIEKEQLNTLLYNPDMSFIPRELFSAIKKDKLDIDLSKPWLSQIYKKNKDGTRTLIINQQKYPNVTDFLRYILETCTSMNSRLLMPVQLHQLFGGFKLEYNKEFREFLLDNLDEILSNSEYQTYISSIQKNFKSIKTINSNRKLTLDLAVSYVQQNKYENVEVGNDKVAEISAIAGYTQEDFDTLQKIYNYGKQRVFSSIPRIEGNTEKYTYEMLRLDDPLAMAIGTLTDCCQEIGNVAETCMEHSMVDKNGRVFVIKDKEGNIVSQSWVWRNKDVICFDNIEIPNKAFERVEDKYKFTDEVYNLYEKAAQEIMEQDDLVYKKLLNEGKITQEQYSGLKLKKVTVGIGYNDIKNSIIKHSSLDYYNVRPLPFDDLVNLNSRLYINDSTTQYILKENEKENDYDVDTLQVHNDLYKIYDDSNFNEKDLLALTKLELQLKEYSDIADILNETKENLVSEIGNLYDLYAEKPKILMNANFAIIYGENDNNIKIADILYNTKIQNEEKEIDIEPVVILQIRLALEQIGKNKEIDISNLDDISKKIYNKAKKLTEDNIDEEKGIKINR